MESDKNSIEMTREFYVYAKAALIDKIEYFRWRNDCRVNLVWPWKLLFLFKSDQLSEITFLFWKILKSILVYY